MVHARIPIISLADRRAYSPAEVAGVTGFSISFIYELIKSGALRSRRVAGRRIVTAEALAELLGEAIGAAPCKPSSALGGETPQPTPSEIVTRDDHDARARQRIAPAPAATRAQPRQINRGSRKTEKSRLPADGGPAFNFALPGQGRTPT
jgi:hypothetical protein